MERSYTSGLLTQDDKLTMAINKMLRLRGTKYTVVDYLLNIEIYSRAHVQLTHWNTLLGQGFHVQPLQLIQVGVIV